MAIKCNILKNLFDSYGLTVIVPVQWPENEVWNQRLLVPLRQAWEKVDGAAVPLDTVYPHLTLFSLLRSQFVLPDHQALRARCQERLYRLQTTQPASLSEKDTQTLDRFSEGLHRDADEARDRVLRRYNEIVGADSDSARNSPLAGGQPIP